MSACGVADNNRLQTASLDDNSTASFAANSGWETLSLFVVEEIMFYLDLPDILESGRVCSHWYSVVQDKTFWKKLLKNYQEHTEDKLELVPVLEPYLLYKRLYKMEHTGARAVVSWPAVRECGHFFKDNTAGVQFSNSGQYVFTSSCDSNILWRKNQDTGYFEVLKTFPLPDHGFISGFEENSPAHYHYRLFNDSDDYILIINKNDNYMAYNFMVQVYSIPDCSLLKKVQVETEAVYLVNVCWFGRCTFLVEYMNNLIDAAVFTLYSVNEEFEPRTMYTHYFDEDEYLDIVDTRITVLNDNNEKIIVFFRSRENTIYYQEKYEFHILRATSNFSGELFGPNTSSCLTERNFSSPDPNHYRCSPSLTKTVDFEVRQFSDQFPGKIAMLCLIFIPGNADYFTEEIRLYDFQLNHLHTFPVRTNNLNYIDYAYKLYIDQRSILQFNDTVSQGKIKYFDIKHKVGVDIEIGHPGSIRAAAFSPTNPDILCSIYSDGDVKFFDFSV